MKTITRRSLLGSMARCSPLLALGPRLLAGSASEHEETKPNIVLIVADDMGWADVGYHNPEIKTPVLDRLARTGVELDWHYVQPQCTPTRVALMTGRYPSRFGSHCTQASNQQAFPIGTLTMASMLKEVGYETALTGKWHMGSKPEWGPNHYGFDHSYGSLAGATGMYDHRYRLNTPFRRSWHRNLEFVEEVGHATDLATDEAVEWIAARRPRRAEDVPSSDRGQDARDTTKPFFLYVPYQNVHTPLVEDHRLLALYDDIENPDRRLMGAALTHLDRCVGRIVAAVDRSGQRENTLIIFFSDNGGIHTRYGGNNYPPPDPPLSEGFSLNTPLRSGKTHVYEGGIRVPAFVNWPAKLRPAKVFQPMHAVDWMPTLASLVGFAPEEQPAWDGRDVWPAIAGEQESVQERQFYWVWGARRNRVALRQGRWKILRDDAKAAWELYDLQNDPREMHNLADAMPDKLQQLLEAFEREEARDAL